jgi:predicted small metal-binding protein
MNRRGLIIMNFFWDDVTAPEGEEFVDNVVEHIRSEAHFLATEVRNDEGKEDLAIHVEIFRGMPK